MTLDELHKFIALVSKDHTTSGVLTYKAALDIYQKAKQIEYYISEYDAVNQAVEYFTNKWQALYTNTKDKKYLKYIATANRIYSKEIPYNEAELLFRGKYFETFEELLQYAKTCYWSQHLSYKALKSIFDMMEISYDNQDGES